MIDEILLFHHSHLDAGYTHSQPILWELQQEYLTQVVTWLEDTVSDFEAGAAPKWTCEATEPVLRWIDRSPQDLIDRFFALCRTGRIGLTALRWHTTALADAASLRRLLDGKRRLEAVSGLPIQVACQFDVTGVPWRLADELIDHGVDFFVMATNIHLGRAAKPRPGLFLWEAPSGRHLRVLNGNHYTMFDQLLYAWDDSVERMKEGWTEYEAFLQSQAYPHDFIVLSSTCSPVMWDNAPPNPFMPGLIERWNREQGRPSIRYATLGDVRRRAARIDDRDLPVLRGDWTDFWNFGCASAPIATGLSRRAKPLMQAAALVAKTETEQRALVRAADAIDLYDEHTFGYYDSRHSHPQAQTTELLKQALAHEGYELASFALMSALDNLAGNPTEDRGGDRVLIVNASDAAVDVALPARDGAFAIPFPAAERTYRASRLSYDNRPWVAYDPVMTSQKTIASLSPSSWVVRSAKGLQAGNANSGRIVHSSSDSVSHIRTQNFVTLSAVVSDEATVDNRYYKLTYQPTTGRVISLFDKTTKRELLASEGLGFFTFVRERPDALVDGERSAFYKRDLAREKYDRPCWAPWQPVHERATKVLRCAVEVDDGSFRLVRELQAPGALYMRETLRLDADDPLIRLRAEIELLPDPAPQSIYFGFSIALDAGWEAAFDSASISIRLDEDQLPGSCRNWVTAENYAAMWDSLGGVALFVDEAPMVQIGGFNFRAPMDHVERGKNPTLLAWPVSNYWDTNFPRIQPGRMVFNYGLTGIIAPDLAEIGRRARAFRMPGLFWPVTANGREAGHGVIEPSNRQS